MSGDRPDVPPFFIVGSARSGTTLLRLILNAHPLVAVPPESRFIVELWHGTGEVDVDRFIDALAAHTRFQAWDLPVRAVRDEIGERSVVPYAEAVSAPYRAYARVHGKRHWGDKTPRYVEHIGFIAALFPTSRFVHLIRDGRNVALSYADVPFGPKTVAQAAALWSKRVCDGFAEGRNLEPGRYIEIRYEDLVADAEGEVKELCAFLGVDYDAAMMDHTEQARGAVLPRATRFNPHVTERPLRDVRAWESDMRPEHVEIFEAVAGDTLSELGYPRRFPAPSRRARAIAALSARGMPLGRLKRSTLS